LNHLTFLWCFVKEEKTKPPPNFLSVRGFIVFVSGTKSTKIVYLIVEHKHMKVKVCRKEHFNAAHRLHNPEWDEDTNQRVFGKCNNPNYHGHNYELIVEVTGEINPSTGYVYDMKQLSDLIQEHIIKKFDHKNLNLDTEEFKNLNPTAENIAVVIWQKLRALLPKEYELKVKLYETERNFVEFPA
jgi:6-pyruvoyltetrahydropterin/6-carboxytetrahydropterin synthase